jgi:biotin transporter BioY
VTGPPPRLVLLACVGAPVAGFLVGWIATPLLPVAGEAGLLLAPPVAALLTALRARAHDTERRTTVLLALASAVVTVILLLVLALLAYLLLPLGSGP